MKTRTTLIALAAAAATLSGLAAPAFAQTRADVTLSVAQRDYDRYDDRRGDDRRGYGHRDDRAERMIENRIANLDHRIDQGRRSGQISRREAIRLESRLRDIVSLKRQYERSGRGLNGREVASLDARLDSLSGQIRSDRHDRNRW